MVLRIWPNDASGAVSVPRAAEGDQRRRAEVDAIEDVEDLDAQLDVGGRAELRPRHELGERQVRRAEVRTDQIVAADVAERARPAAARTPSDRTSASGLPVTASSGPRPGA